MRVKTLLRDESLLFHSKFHQDWGQLFKSGYQDSRFATQVTTFEAVLAFPVPSHVPQNPGVSLTGAGADTWVTPYGVGYLVHETSATTACD